MSDEIIAAIEAPRQTSTLIGHDEAEAIFTRAWAGGRLAHGWLISGPAGIGKATLAWRIARYALNLARTPSLAIDPQSATFRQIAAGAHPDCRLVRRSINPKSRPAKLRGEIAVDDIRALGPFLRRTAAQGGWRVVVIDTADEMNDSAANALLKLLEEPPPQVLLLLVSHAPSRLLPTIRSRCRTLPLRPLSDSQVSQVIAPHAGASDIPAEDLATIARMAEGSPGRALALIERGGLAAYRDLLGLMATLPDLDIDRLLNLADGFASAKGEGAYRTYTELLLWWLTSLVRAGARRTDASILPEEREIRERLLSGGLDPWLSVWEKTRDLFARADRVNLDRKQVVLNVYFALAEAART
ncbi:MAG: DNA polymerase III subunit delta' [Alphaproteobacteria bacterium]